MLLVETRLNFGFTKLAQNHRQNEGYFREPMSTKYKSIFSEGVKKKILSQHRAQSRSGCE